MPLERKCGSERKSVSMKMRRRDWMIGHLQVTSAAGEKTKGNQSCAPRRKSAATHKTSTDVNLSVTDWRHMRQCLGNAPSNRSDNAISQDNELWSWVVIGTFFLLTTQVTYVAVGWVIGLV
jgi:hypothetical protein